MLIAVTRKIGPEIARCELTHQGRVAIDVALAREQHARYEACLRDLACRVISLPEAPGYPDAVFVEDTALVLKETAVLLRPGAPSRRGEVASIAEALTPFRPLRSIEPPGTVDGGDLLVIKKTVYVGIGGRTNTEGVDGLKALLAPLGYAVRGVAFRGCLHLKSAVTRVGPEMLLANRPWFDGGAIPGMEIVDVDPSEPTAANALCVGKTVIFPKTHRRTMDRLDRRGLRVCPVDTSEIAKAEGGVTCCSLVFEEKKT